jgi:hypothetical protein
MVLVQSQGRTSQTVELGNGSRVAFYAEREHAEKVAKQFKDRVVTSEPEDDDDPWDDDDDDFEVPAMSPEILANIAALGG